MYECIMKEPTFLSIDDDALGIDRVLACEKAVKGDTDGALERIGRCVEVFERYPGLIRFEMG